MCGYFQLDRACDRVNVGVVVLVDAGLEGAGADGILGSQADFEGDGLLWGRALK